MKKFDQLIERLEKDFRIQSGSEFSRAIFPEGELMFREKNLEGIPYLEVHVQIKQKFQGKGHAAERIKELIQKKNMPAYFSHGRILNERLYKVFDKIKLDNRFKVTKEETGVWIEPTKQ